MAKPPIEDIMRALMSQDGNVIPFPSGRARPPASSVPPISRDPWYDMRPAPTGNDIHGQQPRTTPGFQGDPPGSLYVWATGPGGKRVRVDGPFANEFEAQKALRDANKSGVKLNLDIGPMPG